MLLRGFVCACVAAFMLATSMTGNTLAGMDGKKAGEQTAGKSQYVLLLFEPPEPGTSSPEAQRAIVEEYKAWARAMHAEGKLAGGDKLHDARAILAPEPGKGKAVTLPKDTVLGGYFIIIAASDEEALAIAKTCPHHKYGGTIEIRKIEIV